MWWTSAGERVLRGAEWALFQAGLGGVWDLVEDSFSGDDLFSCGLAAFDDLQPGQKLALAAQVGQALHDETVPPPELTAHAEAAIAAVFEHVRQSVEAEIGMQPVSGPAEHAFSWRRLIAAACRESGAAGDEPLPDEACDDVSEWALLLDCLADRILWDDDYAVANHFLDADPETSRGGRHLFGIADDYYTALARDPTRRDSRPPGGRCERSPAGRSPESHNGWSGLPIPTTPSWSDPAMPGRSRRRRPARSSRRSARPTPTTLTAPTPSGGTSFAKPSCRPPLKARPGRPTRRRSSPRPGWPRLKRLCVRAARWSWATNTAPSYGRAAGWWSIAGAAT